MVTLLRKLFIADYKNTKKEEVRASHGVLASFIGIFSNTALVLIKASLAIFLAYQSNWAVLPMALLVDAANNLSDMASSIVTMIGFKVANKPADEKHPFGHERAEYVSGLVVSFMVLLIAFETIRESISKIINGQTVSYDILTIVLLAISVLIKVLQGYCYFSLGKAIDSKALKASAIDSLGDVFATSAVLVAAILSLTLGWGFLDPYLGLGIAVLVAVAGIRMMIENIDPIIGGRQDKNLAKEIRETALSRKEALGIHDLIIHSYGPTKKFISFHLEVSETMSLSDAHRLADEIEEELKEKERAEVLIHVDPVEENDLESESLEKEVAGLLKKISPSIELHDFRLIRCAKEKKVSFDVTLPFSLSNKKSSIEEFLRNEIDKKNDSYRLIIHFDHPF